VRTGSDGLVHVLDDDDRPVCDDKADELAPTGTSWPPIEGMACPACQQVASALGQ
jgi:hypothetical protein